MNNKKKVKKEIKKATKDIKQQMIDRFGADVVNQVDANMAGFMEQIKTGKLSTLIP